jgi:hypothetical protein
MFCPPPVRQKYLKKYGKKRVEEYERHVLLRQQRKNTSKHNNNELLVHDADVTTGSTTTSPEREHEYMSSKKLKRLLHKRNTTRKDGSNNKGDNDTSAPVNGFKNGSRRWTEEDSQALLELGENGKSFILHDNDNDDDSRLDDEFHAYSSGSSCYSGSSDDNDVNDAAATDQNKTLEDMYRDSDGSNSDDGNNNDNVKDDDRKHGTSNNHYNTKNLWSLPDNDDTKDNAATTKNSINSLDLMNGLGQQDANKTITIGTNRTLQHEHDTNSSNHGNVFGVFVTAIQGMGGFFKNNNNNNRSNHSTSHRHHNASLASGAAVNENNNIASVSKEEQQKRADELLSALGVFGVASFHDDDHRRRQEEEHKQKQQQQLPNIQLPSTPEKPEQLTVQILDIEPTELLTSDHHFDNTKPTTTTKVTREKSFEDDVDDDDDDDDDIEEGKKEHITAVPYFGGTYEEYDDEVVKVDIQSNNNNDENIPSTVVKEDVDKFDDIPSVELSSTHSSSNRRRISRTKRTINVDIINTSSESVHSTLSNATEKEQLLNMDISILAHSFAVSRNILDEDCKPSPKQKRMLISHFAQLQRKKTTKHKQQMQKKLSKDNADDENEQDEIVDIDEDEKGEENSSDDDEENVDNDNSSNKHGMEVVVTKESKKKNMKSGLNHVGSDVFLATQRRSRYYGSSSSNGSIISYGSGRSTYSRRGCRSVTSLSNIDEDSVVEITDDNTNIGLPMVNRLILTPSSPGTVWEDHRGNVVMNRTYNNIIPDFKPRLEEDDMDDASEAKSTDSDDNNTMMNRSHHSESRNNNNNNDDDSRTAVSSSSSSRISTPKKLTSPGSSNMLGIESPFCFGGILLATSSHFDDTAIDEKNINDSTYSNSNVETYNNYDDSISVTTEASRKSTSSSVSKLSTMSRGSKSMRNIPSPLAALIHPMNRELFNNDDTRKTETTTTKIANSPKLLTPSPRKIPRTRNDDYGCDELESPRGPRTPPIVSYTPKKQNNDEIPLYNTEQYQIVGHSESNNENKSRLSSSFRSSSGTNDNRVVYNLSGGKKSMTKDERIKVQTMLPKRPIFSSEDLGLVSPATSDTNEIQSVIDSKASSKDEAVFTLGESKRRLSLSGQLKLSQLSVDDETSLALARMGIRNRNRTIGVLLIEPTMKIFEVVFLEDLNVQETTVGEVLAKVRANAVDPTLSEQKYNSLCNEDQELAAPMLPVDYLLSNTVSVDSSQNTNETPLLVAVPIGCTACEMQAIKKILWSNPKTARWWDQKDPTRPLLRSKSRSESSLIINDENSENESTNKISAPPVAA